MGLDAAPIESRRRLLLGTGAIAGAMMGRAAVASTFDSAPLTVNGEAMPTTPADRTAGPILDIRRIADLLRSGSDRERVGKIDIVVADAAIQRWKPLLEMDDSDWYDVIDKNLTARRTRSVRSHLSL